MSGAEKLTSDNHDLFRRMTHLLNLRWSWEAIALDVGVYSINDLAVWYVEYRSPKPLPMVAAHVLPVPVRSYASSVQAAKFIAWRRENIGARKALAEAGL